MKFERIDLLSLFSHVQFLENSCNLVHDIAEHPTAENHDKNVEHPRCVWPGGDVAVADGDHCHDRPVVAHDVLGFPFADGVAHLVLVIGQPGQLRNLQIIRFKGNY